MKEDLISVIIPVYNVHEYLSECLESVISQTYEKLEIICVDDGSSDESGTICDEIAKKDSRIKVIHTSNQGLAMARNNGLNYVTGEYIAFIDSDDCIEKNYIYTLYKLLKCNNADIAGCRFYRNSNDGQYIYPNEDNNYDVVLNPIDYLVRFYNDFGVFAPAWGKLFKASLWENFRFYDRRFIEDAPVIRPIVLKCSRIVWCQKPLYLYRNRSNSLINTTVNPNACIDWILDDIDFYKQNNMVKLKAVAEKTVCYTINNLWDFCTTEQKKNYKSIYRKSLFSFLFHKGNNILQKLKYVYIYIIKIK